MKNGYSGLHTDCIKDSYARWIAENALKKADVIQIQDCVDVKMPYDIDVYRSICFPTGLQQAVDLITDQLDGFGLSHYNLLSLNHTSSVLSHSIMMDKMWKGMGVPNTSALIPFNPQTHNGKRICGIDDKSVSNVVIIDEVGPNSKLVNHITYMMRDGYTIRGVVSLLDWECIPVGEIIRAYGLEYASCVTLVDVIEQYNIHVLPKVTGIFNCTHNEM